MSNFLKMVASQSVMPVEQDYLAEGVRLAESSDELFGSRAYLFDGSTWIEPACGSLLIDTPLFHGVVLVLLLAYLLLLFRHPDLVRFVFDRVLSPDTTHSERLYDDRSANSNSHFIGAILFVGVLFVVVFGIKLVDITLPAWGVDILPHGVELVAVPAMAIGLMGVVLLQLILLKATGSITISQPLISALIYIKELYFAFSLFMISPSMILYALCPQGEGRVWFTVIALQVLCVVVLFLRETFLLFISKKVSILHWILYLCAVEMFPATLLCLLAAKILM